MSLIPESKPKILIVDDEPANLRVLKSILQSDYQLTFAKSGEDALKLIDKDKPALILLDIMMPGMSGFDVCKTLKSQVENKSIPIIFVSALSEEMDEATGFEMGAVDYITKPVSPTLVKARVRTHLSLVQADVLKETRLQVIQVLGRASEYKDNETGMHVIRMSHYSKILAKAYGFCDAQAEQILNAAPMHDVGKIGIADSIMLKPGKLTDDEMNIMKTHPNIGADILGEGDSDLLRLARSIALTHHEKWDGSGYPNGLSGEDIPIEGRIVALADVFDALTSKRPYKDAWSVEKTMDLIKSESGLHFDPTLVNLLIQEMDQILAVYHKWQE
ncbi:HD domain-containing phosphohydrolase [Catenovulum adriaticum]|uniref:Response regulator n=1 Tax=Catenovulum adriaticum TaxID=2984846 RepID=A0ABY7ANH2_9ALTE|nr:HD domain-containing phosphohydrolase [Catenovulum sp. TS8]WAJ71105.1 response regulator [Catenovulum sp. TS8]